jgi:hypothetical protein
MGDPHRLPFGIGRARRERGARQHGAKASEESDTASGHVDRVSPCVASRLAPVVYRANFGSDFQRTRLASFALKKLSKMSTLNAIFRCKIGVFRAFLHVFVVLEKGHLQCLQRLRRVLAGKSNFCAVWGCSAGGSCLQLNLL